jgi:uncharacterized protein involved in response to NO
VTCLARWADEPFRIFFPLAVVAGLLGVSMWPLYFFEVIPFYPGMNHSRVMAFGFFGGFMMGFLWTALPRLLSVKVLRVRELLVLITLYVSLVTAQFLGATVIGEGVVLLWLISMIGFALPRVLRGSDLPPPGFVLVLLGFLCAGGGAVISMLEARGELDPEWLIIRQLLEFQGFLLLPVTGVGGFILPRILGLPERQSFDEGRQPSRAWWIQFGCAFLVGLVVIGTFFLEVRGFFEWAYSLRFLAVMGYLTWQIPWHKAKSRGTFVWGLQVGLGSFVAGILLIACFPEWRLPFLHLGLGIGLVMITIVVASRVVLGHSDRLVEMEGRQRWFAWVFGLIFVGVTSRMIGDFIPKILISHYNYGALFWGLGLIIWAYRLLRRKRVA